MEGTFATNSVAFDYHTLLCQPFLLEIPLFGQDRNETEDEAKEGERKPERFDLRRKDRPGMTQKGKP